MGKNWVVLSFLFLALAGPSFSWAQTNKPVPKETAIATPASSSGEEEGDGEEEKEEPFKPKWSNEIEYSHSNQQAGQNTNALSYMGTYDMTEEGNFLSAGLELETQKLEGAITKSDTLSVEGGLGLGFFSPSLTIGYQSGENALSVLSGDLAMNFPLWDPLDLSFSLGGNVGSHQGPVSQFYPSIPGNAQIDTAGWNTSLGPVLIPWDWCSISLTFGYEYDITYQLQDIKNKSIKVPVNQTDQIATVALGFDFTLFKGFVLGLSSEGGQEYYPAGLVYSPYTGGLVSNSSPTTQNFVGGTVSLSYTFD